MNLFDEVQLHRKGIKHETLTFSISELVNMYSARPMEIEISPDFQRLFRWSREQQSSFIESLILEIPVPPLFFYETDAGVWDLLDGLQRLSTIFRFVNAGEVPIEYRGKPLNEVDWHYENENDLTELEGQSFHTLPTSLNLNFKRTRLHIYVLKRETDRMYKYEVFKRLNRGGAPLEEQEIRNCSVRLLGPEFPEFIEQVGSDKNFRIAIGLGDELMRNGYVEELALRFFAMKNAEALFKHDVAAFLTEYMEEVAKKGFAFDYDGERQLFERVWKSVALALPDGEAFRGRRDGRSVGPFSPALFEIISVGIARNVDNAEKFAPDKLRQRIVAAIDEARSNGFTGAGSNSKAKTLGRLQFATKFFSLP
jgi:Protein of unknown function DUF262